MYCREEGEKSIYILSKDSDITVKKSSWAGKDPPVGSFVAPDVRMHLSVAFEGVLEAKSPHCNAIGPQMYPLKEAALELGHGDVTSLCCLTFSIILVIILIS